MEKSPDAFRTISEVSEWLDTPAHVLRFWESRFPQVRPVKRAGGRRYYRPGDVALLGGIKKLLHEDGMTIRGVQKLLREQGIRHVASVGAGAPDGRETAAAAAEDEVQEAPMMVDAPEAEAESNIVAMPFGDAPAEAEAPTPTEPEPEPEPERATPREQISLSFDFMPPPARHAEQEAVPEPESEPESVPEPEPEVEAAAPVEPSTPPRVEIGIAPDAPRPWTGHEDTAEDDDTPPLAARLRALSPASAAPQAEALADLATRLHALRDAMAGRARRGAR